MLNFLKATGVLGVFALMLTPAAAYITHLCVTIGALLGDTAIPVGYGILLFAGTLILPVGVIHGVGYWFGAW
jgi:hypothetical protein